MLRDLDQSTDQRMVVELNGAVTAILQEVSAFLCLRFVLLFLYKPCHTAAAVYVYICTYTYVYFQLRLNQKLEPKFYRLPVHILIQGTPQP